MARGPSRQARQTRRAARRARRQFQRRLLRYLVIFAVGLLGLAVIVGLILPSVLPGGPGAAAPTRRDISTRPVDGPGTPVRDLGQGHFGSGETAAAGYYNAVPPTSGTHAPSWVRCGIHDSPIPDELQVHNLEHGFVLVQYNTQDQGLVDQLTRTVERLPGWSGYYILAPYPKMEQTIALTAWSVVLYLDTVDEQIMRAFADAYRARGPELGTPPCAPGGF